MGDSTREREREHEHRTVYVSLTFVKRHRERRNVHDTHKGDDMISRKVKIITDTLTI